MKNKNKKKDLPFYEIKIDESSGIKQAYISDYPMCMIKGNSEIYVNPMQQPNKELEFKRFERLKDLKNINDESRCFIIKNDDGKPQQFEIINGKCFNEKGEEVTLIFTSNEK